MKLAYIRIMFLKWKLSGGWGGFMKEILELRTVYNFIIIDQGIG